MAESQLWRLAHGDEVSHLADALDVCGDLTCSLLGLLGGRNPPQLRHPVVDLDVDVRHVHRAGVLPDAGPYAVLDLLVLHGDIPNLPPMLLSDKRTSGRVRVLALWARAVFARKGLAFMALDEAYRLKAPRLLGEGWKIGTEALRARLGRVDSR